MPTIKVVVADDHTLFREGIKRILSLEKDIWVVGEAADGQEAVSVVVRTHPDILLLDLKMPNSNDAESLLQIAEKSPSTRVVILTAHSSAEDILDSAKGHARGYILKGVSTPTLIEAIRKVHGGEIWVDDGLPAAGDFARIAGAKQFSPGPPANETLESLTKREMEILKLVAEGLTNEEIGKKVFISEKTVKTHLTNIFDKLQVNNRFKAALLVMQRQERRMAQR